MLIRKLEIISFGKFKNKTIDFNEGLNVIIGNNESGKSTIIAFISAMLYGFGDNRGKGLSLREKYIPWGGDFCEGKILVTLDSGQNITLYRKSGSVKKYDVLNIYDTDTGEDISIMPEEITGVSSETFFKTLCIRQMGSSVDGSNSEIVSRISNIADGGDESISYDKAVKILESAKRDIQPQRGNNGKLAKISEEISFLEKRQQEFMKTKTELKSAEALLPDAKRKADGLKKEYDSLCSEDFSSQIAHLSGRIDEKSKHTKNDNLPLYFISACLLICFFVLVTINTNLSFIFLILSAGSFLYSILKKPREDNLGVLKKELDEKKQEKALHDQKLSSLHEKMQRAQADFDALNTRVISLGAIADESISEKLEELYRQRHTLEKELGILTKVTQAIYSAHEKMQKNFTPLLSKKASEYFSAITGAKYTRLYCDEEFGIKVETDLPRESSYFSGGTVDQLYLSLRLALIDMIFGDKSAPIILDEPFLQYDDIRMTNTVTLFQKLENNRQILLFSNNRDSFSGTEMLT